MYFSFWILGNKVTLVFMLARPVNGSSIHVSGAIRLNGNERKIKA